MKAFYKIDFSQKEQKYVHVELNLKLENYSEKELILMMPVWSPGSYLVREYSRHLDCFEAMNISGEKINFQKIRKNQWRMENPGEEIKIKYRLYCNEFSVRTNFVDDVHALLVAPATFLIPEQKGLCNYFEVEVSLPEGWNQISTGLHRVEGASNKFYAEDTDDFLDCPIEAGNYKTFEFEAFGKPHYVAVIGPDVYDEKILINDMKRVVEATAKILGDIPYEHYTFIVHLTQNSSGGIEHKNSSVLHFIRWDFQNPEKYKRMWLSLVSHEYFHLWNVKRIKPVELADFDYNNENYTSLLWMSEGFTSYFDDLILRRAGIYSEDEYLTVLSYIIERLLTIPGRFYQSVEEASFDAWIKFYRKHENTNNQGISYYVKGAQLALALDFEIRKRTNHQKSLDDLLKMLWNDYLKDPLTGYTKDIIISYAQELAGDLTEIFSEFLEKVTEIDYDKYLSYAGLKLKITDNGKPALGIDIKTENGLLICTYVRDKESGYQAGIMPGDEIIAIDGYRVNEAAFNKRIKFMSIGTKIKITLARDERILEKEVIVSGSKYDSIKIERINNPSEEQIQFFNQWLKVY